MATNRTVAELLAMFRDGLPPKAITPVYFQDMISSLHPMTGQFADLPATPGNVQPGMLWLNGDVVQMSLGGGPGSRLGNFRGAGTAGLAVARPRQRMLGRTQYAGRGGFSASATVSSQPSQPTTFSDDFNTFDPNKWALDSYDEGGDAFWSNDPADVADVYTYSGGKLHLAIINRPSGGKSLTSGISDTYNAQFTGGTEFSQQYGYWEVSVAVDRYPGFEYEMTGMSVANWPPAFGVVRIWTDASNVQHASQFAYDTPLEAATDSNSGWDASVSHAYGLQWTATAVRFYRDRQLVGNFGNPGGPYTNGDPMLIKHWCNTNYAAFPPLSVNPAGLPKYAHIDSLKVWATRPF